MLLDLTRVLYDWTMLEVQEIYALFNLILPLSRLCRISTASFEATHRFPYSLVSFENF
jgi:hypothetical protein